MRFGKGSERKSANELQPPTPRLHRTRGEARGEHRAWNGGHRELRGPWHGGFHGEMQTPIVASAAETHALTELCRNVLRQAGTRSPPSTGELQFAPHFTRKL